MENLEWKDKVDGQDDILAEDINAIAKYANELNSGKVDKKTGKELSSNDFTDNYKSMLDNVETERFIVGSPNLITSGAVGNSISHVMKILKVTVDEELSETSTNPVQNKVITEKIKIQDSVIGGLVNTVGTMSTGQQNGVVYRSDLNWTKEDEMTSDAEIESISNVWIYRPGFGFSPHTATFKDPKAREQIANIPMQKIFETTTTEVVGEKTDDTLTNLKLDEIYVYIKLSSALTESNKTWNCEINGVEDASNYLFYFTANTTGTHFFIKGERMCENLWFTQKTSNLATGVNNQTLYASYNMNGVNYINSLKFNCPGLPAGSTITVCGRRVLD